MLSPRYTRSQKSLSITIITSYTSRKMKIFYPNEIKSRDTRNSHSVIICIPPREGRQDFCDFF